MSTEDNKRVVQRFVKEILTDGNLSAVEEILSENYVNKTLGGANRAAFKEAITGMKAAMPQMSLAIENLVAEGDSVVLRGNMNITRADGKKDSARLITYYEVKDGKIVIDEPISVPDLRQFMGLEPPKSAP